MMSKRVKLNVGGRVFETTYDTLSGSGYFVAMLRWEQNGSDGDSGRKNKGKDESKNDDPELFIDRSYIIFEHVLAFLRDPNYQYPEQYLGELDFYIINKPTNIDRSEMLSFCYNYIKEEFKICETINCHNKKHPMSQYCDKCKPVVRVEDKPCTGDVVYSEWNCRYGVLNRLLLDGHCYVRFHGYSEDSFVRYSELVKVVQK